MYLIKTFIPWLKKAKRNTMGGPDILICLDYIILYDGNIILKKFREDMKPALNHTYKLMSKFLPGLIIFNSTTNLLSM